MDGWLGGWMVQRMDDLFDRCLFSFQSFTVHAFTAKDLLQCVKLETWEAPNLE